MKKNLIITVITALAFLLLITVLLVYNNEKQELADNFVKGVVSKHVDGDTVYIILDDGIEEKLRFIGVNTPETVHPSKPVEFFGEEASDFTKESLLGKTIYLEKDISDTDRYGRLLRYIWLEVPSKINEDEIRNKMFNAKLLLEGYAQVSTFPPDVKYQEYFLTFMKEAKENKIGLWSQDDKFYEIDIKKEDIVADTNYIGNSKTMKFHKKECSSVQTMKLENKTVFETKDEAKEQGFIPCKTCKP